MKKIILICCSALSCIILCFCFSNYTINLNGMIVCNGTEHNADITVKDKHINKLLNRMSGKVYIQIEDNEDDIVYDGTGKVFDLENRFITIVHRIALKPVEPPQADRSAECIWEDGYMHFDKDFKNLVIVTSERQVYAADREFINIVKSVNDNDPRITF